MMANYYLLLAQSGQSEGGMWSLVAAIVIPMVIVWAVLYLLMARPQKKKEQDRRAMLESLKKNDRVLTTGGLFGTVMDVRDHLVVLKVDDKTNTRVKFARSAIVNVVAASKEDETQDGN